MEGFQCAMEAPPWNREEKGLFDSYLLHHSDFEISSNDTSESSSAKRKVESSYGLFCFMRKRIRRHKSIDDDMDLSECSEFDVISEQVLEDMDLVRESTGSKSLAICNFSWPNEDEGTLVNKLSSESQNPILFISSDEVNKETGVTKSKEDVVLSTASASQVSNILLETCSLHQNVSFDNENNVHVHGDHIGLEITPISLTKTLEGSSSSLSVCDSLAAGRNLPLLEDSSVACSSSENRDAELAQNPSALHQEEVDCEDKISFADIDALIHRLNLVPESCLNREEWKMSKHPRYTLLGMEHCTKTSTRRALVFQGAIAVLRCRDSKHYIRKHEVIIGRSSHGLKVDIDLSKDGYGSKISRRQALVKLEENGSFSLKNLGKRHILLNGRKLNTGQIGTLTSCSLINFKGVVYEFKINKEAMRQFLKNNTRRNSEHDAKFRWCE